MRPSLLRLARACACAACLVATAAPAQPPASADAAPIPLASFFDNPDFSGAALSPDARALAVRVGGAAQRDRLAVITLATNTIKVVAQFRDDDVGDFQWVNDNRLLFNARDQRLASGAVRHAPGLYAVNSDGSGYRQLASPNASLLQERSAVHLLPWNTFLLPQTGRQDSDAVYVTQSRFASTGELDHIDLLRLDTVTGRATTVERPAKVRGWLLDHQGEPRLATSYDEAIATLWYRDPASAAWRVLTRFDAYQGGKGAFEPLAFGPDGALYVLSNGGGDKFTLRQFDFARNAVRSEALVELDGYDFTGQLITVQDRLLGVRYLSDADSTIWYDARMKAIQADIDRRLPHTINLITLARHAATPWLLVESYSDRQPQRYTLYNTETQTLNPVGAAYPAIDARRMGKQELVHYKARDGLVIPAWLTIPPGRARKDLPLVVLVHGGPNVRGADWAWRAETQFLASRGYAVLEPEYRGSTGFGMRHFRAGWKQWGLAMQDDIADGAKWAIAEGIADAKRICIAGASYGGYATLMGMVKDPGLYQCGVDWVGVTDIKLLYTGNWSARDDMTEMYRQYGMPVLVGDPVKDAAQLSATSPLVQAARITQPLLLAYGGADHRVPLYHGKKFYEAVKQTNPDVEWVVYGDEGHGWRLPETRIDFWGRVEKFLDRHIGH